MSKHVLGKKQLHVFSCLREGPLSDDVGVAMGHRISGALRRGAGVSKPAISLKKTGGGGGAS